MRIIFLSAFLALLVFPADGASFFRVVEMDLPAVNISPCSEANFSVIVQNIGSDSEYGKLIFRDFPPGLWIVDGGGTKYVYRGGKERFDLVMGAGQIAPGNYTFDIGVAARGSPSNYRRAFVLVERSVEGSMSAVDIAVGPIDEDGQAPIGESEEAQTAQEEAPMPGALAAILAALLGRRLRS
ncbi:MAG: hypothetical protein JW986_10005 [Methanotrichaceae archaeon]|nr:hypothetical protein [Methanotrichaceae archaeon]